MDGSEIENLVNMLDCKAALAYEALKQLLTVSAASDAVYRHFDRFAEMLTDDNSYVRTRGFQLIAANARWDTEGKTAAVLDRLLARITDEKPITARQCIKDLPEIAKHLPELSFAIRQALETADTSGYPGSMRPLVEKDILAALKQL